MEFIRNRIWIQIWEFFEGFFKIARYDFFSTIWPWPLSALVCFALNARKKFDNTMM